ncbi:P-loop containing nucleoside triphosphate hydrolase protein [Stereum hirsutum FP-91666 SS1]|uniref:P-loop containing nucleoside triphosphate hydrolase protein n=1 Tax=Stereum hirsutum (strain FP-91666) TaxID=721885 RepID=UPI00044493EA|nr:P-loop containing nucleoside triphosphate hydrolase protein [Stereum hirsutum FP-91666 SS1]EIM83142.1 P-loop containing nucleoside triphosphate hydrolase protein [Stereum hirsutum FP-91666 SS1]
MPLVTWRVPLLLLVYYNNNKLIHNTQPDCSKPKLAPIFQPLSRVHQHPPSTSSQQQRKRVEGPGDKKDEIAAKRPRTNTVRSTTVSTAIHHQAPLPDRLRPTSLDHYVGHPHLTAPDSPLQSLSKSGALGSIILWGPPGCGKTTLARLLARNSNAVFKELSATIAGINDVRPIFDQAKNELRLTGRRTVIFLDEIHRFTKSQQDIFLPFLEHGDVQLIGATTENPSFKLNSALLSRCRVFLLERLTDEQITEILTKAVARVGPPTDAAEDPSSSQTVPSSSSQESTSSDPPFPTYPHLTRQILSSIASLSTGDARTALSLLELVLCSPTTTPSSTLLTTLRKSVSASYDRTGDSRYEMISALHKSVRGSQPDAAMYWLARMLEAGEDPLYVARRMTVCASEDIGLADRHALPLAMATMQACQMIGMPECRINLAHLVAYLSEAPKSTRAYEAYERAAEAAKKDLTKPVPMQIRNAPTGLMREIGCAEGYRYNPDYAHPVTNTYLPEGVRGKVFLRKEGDVSGKEWDEEALKRWEEEENEGRPWEGRARRD